MEENAKIKLTIDGKEVIVEEGTTILDAARQNGIHIPTLCHHPALSNWGGCRLCVVEVDGAPRLAASCVMPVREAMQVVTSNERILQSRRTMLEFLFAERNHYCMICAQSGDCELQSLAYELQMDHLTVAFSFNKFPVDNTNEYMDLDHNRCILCGRCVRACREIAGNYVLNYQNRGAKALVCKDLNQTTEESTCDSSGVCLQVCPTGAIFNRMRMHYAVKGKAKEMQAIESACPRCGLLCPTIAQIRDNNLVRIDGVLGGDRPDRGQLCRKGRFEPLKTAGQRLLAPMVKGKDGSWTRTTWDDALERVAGRMGAIRSGKGAEALFGLVSGHCSNEEFLLFRDFMGRSFDGSYVDTLAGDQLHTIVQAWKELEKSFLGLREASWKRIPEADLVVFVGANPDERQPLVSALARRSAIEKGVSVGVVGPTDVHRPWTSLYVPAEEKELPLVIKALLAEVVSTIHATDPLTRWKKITDEVEKVKVPELLRKLRLSPEEREAFKRLARAFADAKAPILIAGDGVTGLKDPGALRGLMYLALLKGLLSNDTLRLVILKPNGNSAGALRLGIAADGSRDVTARWRAGLLLLDGEQAMDGKVMDRLSRVEFLAVISPYFPEALAAKAHVLIPKPLWTEQPGSYASLDGSEVGDAKGILSPPAGVRRSWETLMALAGRSGFRPDFESWEALRGKVMAEMKVDDQAR